MAEFTEVMKQRKRMHEQCRKLGEFMCGDCPIDSNNNGKNLGCVSFILQYPQEAEEIIMTWAKAHPIKTNADKFKEVFGFDYKTDIVCPIVGVPCMDVSCHNYDERDFWEKEYKEPEGEE